MNYKKMITPSILGISGLVLSVGMVLAAHNGAVVEVKTTNACTPTTITASITDPDGTHKVANMRLVVDVDGDVDVSPNIPTNGDEVEITVRPFFSNTTVKWRVFGGGERGYDSPLWNGFGDTTFSADVSTYGNNNGYGFVLAGSNDLNPFTNWHEFEVEACQPVSQNECKQGGWMDFGFRNQGQCIRFVNTGQDSR